MWEFLLIVENYNFSTKCLYVIRWQPFHGIICKMSGIFYIWLECHIAFWKRGNTKILIFICVLWWKGKTVISNFHLCFLFYICMCLCIWRFMCNIGLKICVVDINFIVLKGGFFSEFILFNLIIFIFRYLDVLPVSGLKVSNQFYVHYQVKYVFNFYFIFQLYPPFLISYYEG